MVEVDEAREPGGRRPTDGRFEAPMGCKTGAANLGHGTRGQWAWGRMPVGVCEAGRGRAGWVGLPWPQVLVCPWERLVNRDFLR